MPDAADPFPSMPRDVRAGLPAPAEILLLAVRPRRDGAALARARELLARCDGAAVLAGADGDGAGALVHALAREAGGAPPDLLRALADRARLAAARSLRLEGTLARALDALAARGVPVLPLKGPALASLYDPPSLRECEDLDLLVRGADLAAAEAALGDAGFLRGAGAPPGMAAIEDRAAGSVALRDGDGPWIDLHGTLSRAGCPLDLDLGAWWEGGRTATVAGRAVPALPAGPLVHYVLVHGSKELWRRRAWLSDAGRLLLRHPDLDGDAVARAAGEAGTVGLLGLGLALGEMTGAAAAPEGALRRLARDPASRAAAVRVLTDPALAPTAPWTSLRHLRFTLGLRERSADRWRALAGKVLVPRRTDGEAIPLPRWAHPLYRVLRPARLAWKHGRAMAARRA